MSVVYSNVEWVAKCHLHVTSLQHHTNKNCVLFLSFKTICFFASQRSNLQHQENGDKHIFIKFPEEASFSAFTEELNCEMRVKNEAACRDVAVCEKFAVSLSFLAGVES